MITWKLIALPIALSGIVTLGIEEDIIDCEHAMLKLEACCDDSRFRDFNCDNDGCEEVAFTPTQVSCIERQSCAELVTDGYCAINAADLGEAAVGVPACAP